jgi:CspA family cold shock protein
MSSGNITRIVRDKGFGFIKTDDAKEDIFFHRTSVTGLTFDDLEVGQGVVFSIEPDPKNASRSRAADVKTAD